MVSRFPPELTFQIDQGIQQSMLRIQVVLAGVDLSGAHIYGVEDPGQVDCYDRLGYHAVGSGETHALLTLVARGHRLSNDTNLTAYLVYEAKKKAEVAPGVGRDTEMGIITEDGEVRMLSPAEIELLDRAYEEIGLPRSDALREFVGGLPFAGTREKEARHADAKKQRKGNGA